MDDCLAAVEGARLSGRRPSVVHDGRLRLAAWPTTRTTCTGSPAPASRSAPPPRCSSRSRSSAGRSTSSRSCATRADNVVIVCSIENLDPMGVHTGDSITVAPAMTLTDVEFQRLRDIAIGVIREVGVDTGGCNIQFAVNPDDGRIVVIEMNPRVSRSVALASKATGFPIAKIAAKVAIGYTLDEIPNDITRETPASFEPTLDYVVVKVPRFAFEKFPAADATLTTHMKSVGEAMAIGRNFTEALQKALRSPGEPGGPVRLEPPVGRPRQGRAARGDQRPARRPAQEGHGRHPRRREPRRRSSTPPRSTRGSSTSSC